MVGTVTDFDGAFSLDVPSSAKTLVISYVGMKSQEVVIKPILKLYWKVITNSLMK